MNNLLSIDFDFWLRVPKILEMDMETREAPFWIKHMWSIRAATALSQGRDLRKELALAADEPSPDRLGQWLVGRGIKFGKCAVAESHGHANSYFNRYKDINLIHIDAHHDFGYHLDELNCDNWVQHLVGHGSVRRITLIYPKWRLVEHGEWNKCVDGKISKWRKSGIEINVVHGLAENMPTDMVFRKTFICRSGAWVPPWLDTHFINLIFGILRPGSIIYDYKSPTEFNRDLNWPEVENNAKAMASVCI